MLAHEVAQQLCGVSQALQAVVRLSGVLLSLDFFHQAAVHAVLVVKQQRGRVAEMHRLAALLVAQLHVDHAHAAGLPAGAAAAVGQAHRYEQHVARVQKHCLLAEVKNAFSAEDVHEAIPLRAVFAVGFAGDV